MNIHAKPRTPKPKWQHAHQNHGNPHHIIKNVCHNQQQLCAGMKFHAKSTKSKPKLQIHVKIMKKHATLSTFTSKTWKPTPHHQHSCPNQEIIIAHPWTSMPSESTPNLNHNIHIKIMKSHATSSTFMPKSANGSVPKHENPCQINEIRTEITKSTSKS